MGAALSAKDSATTSYSPNQGKAHMLHTDAIRFTGVTCVNRSNLRLSSLTKRPQIHCHPRRLFSSQEQLRLTDPRKGHLVTASNPYPALNHSHYPANRRNPSYFHITDHCPALTNYYHIHLNPIFKSIKSNQYPGGDCELWVSAGRINVFWG